MPLPQTKPPSSDSTVRQPEGNVPGANQEIAAGFRLQRLSGRPNVVPKSRILQQIQPAFLPHQRRIMADLPVDDGGNDELAALFAKGHLIIQADLLREFRHLGERKALLRRGGIADISSVCRVCIGSIHRLDALQRQRPATERDLRADSAWSRALRSRRRFFPLPVPINIPPCRDFRKRFQFRSSAPVRSIHVGQFTHRPVGNGHSLGVRGVLAERPSPCPTRPKRANNAPCCNIPGPSPSAKPPPRVNWDAFPKTR